MNRLASLLCAFLFVNCAVGLPAETNRLPDARSDPAQDSRSESANLAGNEVNADYVLGPGDQITLAVPGLEEQYNQKVFRIDGTGDVTLPLVGRIHVAGMSEAALEDELQVRLKPIVKDPQVVVGISYFGSQAVSVLGDVRNPGILQLQGTKTLFEVLSMAGGLQPDAGYAVQVTRSLTKGTIPLSNVQTDPVAHVVVASIRLKDIIGIPKAAENIEILPGDTVSVPKAGVVYVVGSVTKPGGYSLDENESLSALQVLSLAQGLLTASAASKARILRAVPGAPARTEIPINLSRLMVGKATDVQLRADDILFVPDSKAKKAGIRTIDAIINAATYATIYAH